MRGGDQTVEVAGLAHGRSIGRALRPGNKTRALLACGLLLVARVATATDVSVAGYVDGLAIVDTGTGVRQRPQAVGVLRVDGNAARWLRGYLELRGRIGGPFEGGQGIGVYEYDQAFQNRSPAFDVTEGWVELRARRAELRAGIQRVAWGRLDGAPPTDVVNPRDWHDPFVDDVEERKFGIPMLVGSTPLPDVRALALRGLKLQLLYVPIAVPPRLALAEERWFPSSISFDAGGLRLGGTVAVDTPIGVQRVRLPPEVAVDFGTQNATPARTLENGAIGARLSGSVQRVDWSLYHYTGPETNPNASLPVWVRARRPYTGGLSTPEELLAFAAAIPDTRPLAIARLTQEHDGIHMTGADLAAPLGDATIRAEAAWFIDRPYLRSTRSLLSRNRLVRTASGTPCPILRDVTAGTCPLFTGPQVPFDIGNIFPELDAVEWGLGVDYLWNGFQPILQVNQIVFLEKTPDLLVGDPDTRFTGVLKKRVLEERVELEFRGSYMVEKGGWFAFPRVSWDVRDDLRLRVGYLWIGGSENSIIGQFKGNDEVVFQARWSF